MRSILRVISFFLFVVITSVVLAQNQSDLNSYQQKFKLAIEAGDHQKAAFYSYEIAGIFFQQRKLHEAIDQLNTTLSYSEKINNNNISKSAWYTLGLAYMDLKEYNDALKYFKKSLKLAETEKDQLTVADNAVGIAQSYAAMGRHKRSIEPLEQALAIYTKLEQAELRQYCYSLLSEYHHSLGNTAKANEYLSHYSLMANENNRQRQLSKMEERINIVEAEKSATQYELNVKESELEEQSQQLLRAEDSLREVHELTEKQQLEINLLNTEKELSEMSMREQEARIKNDRLLRNSLIGGVVLAGALICVIFIDYRRKIRTNQKIHQQNLNIKSSINYAQRIQQAMLPVVTDEGPLSDSFILFKPRDIVSGDFYWFAELERKISGEKDFAIAAVDCTGHGIPGAFMSMIGMNSLNGIINRGIRHTDEVLLTLHNDIKSALRQDETGNRDGMDMALCLIRKQEKILEFSGAKNPLIYIQDNELYHIKGDTHAIGGGSGKVQREVSFKRHEIKLDQPTMIYIFSDGYADQFGGPDSMKFMSKRFKELLMEIHHLPLEEQKTILNDTFEEWRGKGRQIDDILVIGFKLNL